MCMSVYTEKYTDYRDEMILSITVKRPYSLEMTILLLAEFSAT